jgi:hypothetical protein
MLLEPNPNCRSKAEQPYDANIKQASSLTSNLFLVYGLYNSGLVHRHVNVA